MNVTPRLRQLILAGGLAAATVGMALVAFGVAVSGLFFPGIYLLVLGLLASGAGALLHVLRRD